MSLGLSQRLMLEGESFQATLTLNSIVAQPVENITVTLLISDASGADARDLFTIVPASPTDLGNLPGGGQVIGDWLIVPTVEVTRSQGENFRIRAQLDYDYDNQAYRFTTIEETITVFPAPELIIDYELPDPSQSCTVFDLKATVRNEGDGPARSVRMTGGQPRVVKSSGGDPQSFEIVSLTVNGATLPNPAMAADLGDISSGGSSVVVWRIEAQEPGKFIEFSSDYRMRNYTGDPLAPSLRGINTTLTPNGGVVCQPSGGGGSTYSISGVVSDGSGQPLEGVTVSSSARTNTTTGPDGAYTLNGLAEGTYVVIPAVEGYVFTPTSRTVALSSNINGIDFAGAEGTTYSISGKVQDTENNPVAGTVISLNTGQNMTTNASGVYILAGLITDTYTIIPGEPTFAFTFLPETGSASVSAAVPQVTGLDFIEYNGITGMVHGPNNAPLPGATVSVVGGNPSEPITNSYTSQLNGHYHFVDLPFGENYSYQLSVSGEEGYIFIPEEVTIPLETSTSKVVQDFDGSTGVYNITGQVTEAGGTAGIPDVEIKVESARQSFNETTNTQGNYTVVGVLDGFTYTVEPSKPGSNYLFWPRHSTATIDGEDANVSFEGSTQTYQISGKVEFVQTGLPIPDVEVQAWLDDEMVGSDETGTDGAYSIDGLFGEYTLKAVKAPYVFDEPTVSVIVDDATQDITTATPPPLPNDPTITSGFKGANWLEPDDQDYHLKKVGWNLELSDKINEGLATQINQLYTDPLATPRRVQTIIRLEVGPPNVPIDDNLVNRPCSDFNNWMTNVDNNHYTRLLNNELNVNAEAVPFFILDNEPNLDWGYNAAQYAHVYNCYYHHWRVEQNRPHYLLAAGPGDQGGAYVQFYQDLLNTGDRTIAFADGFAIHAYGYYVRDTNGNSDIRGANQNAFRDWLYNWNQAINGRSDLQNKPVFITEYNPGALDDWINIIPADENGQEDWENWFNKTYCWAKYDESVRVNNLRGLLYFVDDGDRDSNWYEVSLQSAPARREAWLNTDPSANECIQILSDPQSSLLPARNVGVLASLIPSPVSSSNSQTANSLALNTIGGVISGTLGTGGLNNVFYVTEDLTVPAGQTLTITLGTTLVFSPNIGLDIAGQLIADGNRVFPIRFISTNEAGWRGLHFQPTAQGSRCIGCYLENVESGGVALNLEAPITFQLGLIRDVGGGTAISSTMPMTLTNTIIDYVGTGIRLSGSNAMSHTIAHLTLGRCQQGIVNQGQTLVLENSILTACDLAVSTELSGTTAISYTLLYNNVQDFNNISSGSLNEGAGLLYVDPRFIDFPNNYQVKSDSPTLNVANPSADYSREFGYNGGRANLGAYGNTWQAPQQPPLEQMDVDLRPLTTHLTGIPGQTLSYTLRLKNDGIITDSYIVAVDSTLPTWLDDASYRGSRRYILVPQEEITITLWVEVEELSTQEYSRTISVRAFNGYGVEDEAVLEMWLSAFQEDAGQIVIEAEHFSRQSQLATQAWLTQTVLSGFMGTSYLNTHTDTGLTFTTAYTISSPELNYILNLTTTGVYTVWLRGYAPDGAGDSMYIGLDEHPPQMLTGFAPRIWDWANLRPPGIPVAFEITEPGLHTLRLWQREDGLRLDRILLTNTNALTPTAGGPSESKRN